TRMPKLASDPQAFIRPSPSAGSLGGVARATRETMVLLEAAGYDVVLVETVGVGQSEITVAEMVDFFLVLMLPGAGDELQGIKKGILEIADMVAVNKADGDNRRRAEAAKREYEAALHILTPASPNWSPPVVLCAGLTGEGLDELWQKIEEHRRIFTETGEREEKRQGQQIRWMWAMLEDRLISSLRSAPAVREALPSIEADVAAGVLTPSRAVDTLLAKWRASL
ncbi:MAG TPA: methylmalonyl Co-A mutase-associated GTPase MeaB, partial [Alphaproteobacteria bacterium]|nr:methylmalonyl Co-A mutase-associated GTPase MeaB [Alphaproteobacteria bacterium]